jgi:hypothetical protein
MDVRCCRIVIDCPMFRGAKMLKTISLTVAMLSFCFGWTAGAQAEAELVKFLGSGTTYGTVQGEAAAAARDVTLLGISTSIRMDDHSGEYTIEVLEDGVQVAVLSDDGVSVQVTDLGDIDDLSGPEPVSLPGLAHFGEGQDLPRLDQSLKLIPGTLTANHRYRYQWQYRNTFQTGPADINGMKVFVFGGAAQLALAGDVAFLSPTDVNGKTWDQLVSISPDNTTYVFPGKTLTLQVIIPESDSYRVLAGGVFGARQNVPFELEAEEKAGVIARITLINAHFDTGEATKDFPLTYDSGKLALIPKPRIVANQNLSASQKVTATIAVTDPGRPPAAIPGVTFVNGQSVADPVIGKSVSWNCVPTGLAPPDQVRGYTQRNFPPAAGVPAPVFDEFLGRHMKIVYQYLPDRNGATEAANYDGIPVLETFSPMTVTIANKSMELVQDKVLQAFFRTGDTVDTLFTRWMEQRSHQDGTFTIFSVIDPTGEYPSVFDITEDTYQLTSPEAALGGFFKPANWSQPVTVTRTQTYECPSDRALTGDMPAILSSSCNGLVASSGNVLPKTPKQKVSPISP